MERNAKQEAANKVNFLLCTFILVVSANALALTGSVLSTTGAPVAGPEKPNKPFFLDWLL